MVQTATFKVDYPDWFNAFQGWVDYCGMNIVEGFRFQAKQIASALVNGYEEVGRKSWNQSTPPNDRKQGEAAVARDITRSIYPLRADGFRDVKVRKAVQVAVRNEDVPALQAMVRAGVFGANRVNIKVLPAGNEWTAHQNSRSSRGRVRLQRPNYAVPAPTWEYIRRYIREQQQGVGQAKGGWAKSLEALGGRVPAWVSRHRKAGLFVDNLKEGQAQIGCSMINRSKWGAYDEGGEASRIVDQVMSVRERMIEADLENMISQGFVRDARGRTKYKFGGAS